MQETIHGIVLRVVRYKDTRQIVDLYTRERGRMAFVAHLSASGRGRSSSAVWRLLNIVEIETNVRPTEQLPWVRTCRITHPWTTLCTDPVKGTLCLFLSELLSQALREQQAEPLLFQYICDSFRWLDTATDGYANFHLVFFMRLMQFLGIRPDTSSWREGYAFNLSTGEFQPFPTVGPTLLAPDEARLMPLLLRMNYTNMRRFALSRAQRRRIVEVLGRYFSLQLPPFPQLRSVDVLAEVFGGSEE